MEHLLGRDTANQDPYDIALREDARLAPYAVRNAIGYGRIDPETRKLGDERTRFFIDVGRAIHSEQIRSLFGKAQVYPSTVVEQVSNRGTHSHEVAYLSEGIARTLGLNQDLVRVGGLFHDAGHPPFGHEGEDALKRWASLHGQDFEHNAQLLRIVTKLAKRGQKRGMNFNIETLRVFDKHGDWFGWQKFEDRPLPFSFLEAQVVNLVDAIEYFSGDAQDALTSGTLTRDILSASPLFARALAISDESKRDLRSELIHLLALDLTTETRRRIECLGIESLDDVCAASQPIVGFSPGIDEHMKSMKTFMYANMYRHETKTPYRAAVHTTINLVCCWCHNNPNEEILEYETLSDHTDTNSIRVQAVLDYVSSLRDRDAISLGQSLGLDNEMLRLLSEVFGKHVAYENDDDPAFDPPQQQWPEQV